MNYAFRCSWDYEHGFRRLKVSEETLEGWLAEGRLSTRPAASGASFVRDPFLRKDYIREVDDEGRPHWIGVDMSAL